MDFRQVSECLDSELMAVLIGGEAGCSPPLDAPKLEASSLVEFERAGSTPAEPNRGTGATSAPAKVAAREEWRRREFTVIRGGLAALPMQPPRKGVPRARAAGPRLITIDGERVHAAAFSRSRD